MDTATQLMRKYRASRVRMDKLIDAIEKERDDLLTALQAERERAARLAAALRIVEWVSDEVSSGHCPWCGGLNPDGYLFNKPDWWDSTYGEFEPYHPRAQETIGHKSDCPRQAALNGKDGEPQNSP